MEKTVTINVEQMEDLLRDREYAKEWKAMKYNELLEENIRQKGENKEMLESKEFWEKEYLKQDEKAERYRNKYLKWKKKMKELIIQEKQEMKKVKRCYECNKPGHLARECYSKQICRKCNRTGHTEKICRCSRKGIEKRRK